MKVFYTANRMSAQAAKVADSPQVDRKAWYEDEMCDIGGGVCHKALSPD